MDNRSSPAKITRPRTGEVVPRHRLFRILDRARAKPFLWIMGPPGAGKTALVADYLSHRRITTLWYQIDAGDAEPATFFHYLTLAAKKATPRHRRPLPRFAPGGPDNLDRYTRDFFLDLGARLKSSFYLVFDNYHELPAGSAVHDILRIAGESLPTRGQIIVLSRLDPPPALARARLHGDLVLLEGDPLALTLPEARGVSQKLGRAGRAQDKVDALHKQTQGWAAGFILLLEQTGRLAEDDAAPPHPPGVLFEYFASEVFAKADASTRQVLLAASFLPGMTARNVATLSGERRAGRILAQLHRNHLFTDRYDLAEPEYRFHPLFREFLRSRAQRLLPAEAFAALRRGAARLLEESGLHREEALSLYREARDWHGWMRTFLQLAPQLIGEGRHHAVGRWIQQVPPEIFGSDPWLRYWRGLASLPDDPAAGRAHLEEAMKLFVNRNDAAGARRAWHNLLRALLAEGAERARLEECLACRDSLPAGDIDEDADLALALLRTLMRTGPASRDTAPWINRVQTLLHAKTDPVRRLEAGAVLLRQHAQAGEPTQAAAVARHLETAFQRTGDATEESQVEALAALALNQWLAAETDAARRTIERAIALAEQGSQCRALPGLFAEATATALSCNDLDAAEDWLDRQARVLGERRTDEIVTHHLLANWHALLRGDLPDANEHLAIVRRLRPETLSWFIEAWFCQAQAQTQLQSGNPEKAAASLADLLRLARRHNNPRFRYAALLLTAQLALEENRPAEARAALAEALQTGRRQGIVNFHGWLARPVARLCALALEHDIETEYVRDLIRLRALPAMDDARDLDAWPWPVKIFSFGRLSILREEQPVSFSRRAQSRPLEMLTALLANGGRGVSEETLSTILWPDADGDAAHQAFDTNLFRLRRLLGTDRALILSDAKLSLNPAVCWVDAWACERLFGRLDTLLRASSGPENASDIARLGLRLLALYRGPFLGRDHSAPWAVAARERLHNRLLRQLNLLIRYWEDNGQWDHAVTACERLIDIQPEAEEHYQRLMIAYRKLDRLAEAAAVYERCQETLLATLGRPPSPATLLIFRDLGTFSNL